MLLSSCQLEPLGNLNSRVVMAAMTRGFAGEGHVATDAMAEYYGRRAEAGIGLIITEGTIVDVTGDGYNGVPHIATQVQAESWKRVVDRVHAAKAEFSVNYGIAHITLDYTGGEAL